MSTRREEKKRRTEKRKKEKNMFASKEERFQKACEKGKIDNVKKILEKNPEFLNASLNRV